MQFTLNNFMIYIQIVSMSNQLNMNQLEQNQTEFTLLSLVDNFDLKKDIGPDQYIILIKKQKGKNYSTLYLTDCENNFWLRKIDLVYIQELKSSLNLKTNTETFIKCLMKSLKENCTIHPDDQNTMLQIKLSIGEGLTMTCNVKFTANIQRSKDQNGHKIILKLFLRQLYQSKQSHEMSLRQQIQALKKQKEQEKKLQIGHKDNKFINQIFNLSQEKKDIKNMKNRDLMNPNKKKRKHAGIKLSTPN